MPWTKLTACLSLLTVACAPPPAPEELDELCGYLYAHFDDEKTRALEAGLVNLDAWMLAHLDETLEGYSVTNLSDATISALDDRSHNVDQLLGAAVGTTSASFDPYAIGAALSGADQQELIPDAHVVYERTYVSDLDCFLELECELLTTTNHLEDDYPILGEVISESFGEYRWIELDKGLAMVQRTWLLEPSQVEWDSFELNDQYYLNILLPRGGGTLTLQSMWVDATLNDSSVSEALALNLLISQMQGVYEQVDSYLEQNGAAEQPEGCATSGARPRASLPLLALLGMLAWRQRRWLA